jgi:hypothetical protein
MLFSLSRVRVSRDEVYLTMLQKSCMTESTLLHGVPGPMIDAFSAPGKIKHTVLTAAGTRPLTALVILGALKDKTIPNSSLLEIKTFHP